MGIYVPFWDQPGVDDLDITDLTFRSPDDVLAWGRRDSLVTWKTWPEVWHLDQDGVFHCYFRASSGDGIRRWCEDAEDLYISHYAGPRAVDGCAPTRTSPTGSWATSARSEPMASTLGELDELPSEDPMPSFERFRVSTSGQMSLPAAARRRWDLEQGGPVEVLDLEFGVLVVPEGGAGRLLDLLYPADAHYAFVDEDDDPDLQTT